MWSPILWRTKLLTPSAPTMNSASIVSFCPSFPATLTSTPSSLF